MAPTTFKSILESAGRGLVPHNFDKAVYGRSPVKLPQTGDVGGNAVYGHIGDYHNSSLSFVFIPDCQMRYDDPDGPDDKDPKYYIFRNRVEVSFWDIHHCYFLG